MSELRECIIKSDETDFYDDTQIFYYFHKWITRYHGNSGKGDEMPYALVETPDRRMHVVKYHNIKFKDKP